jgi:membrane carboxypeptidase/penicillin-binding protein
VRGQGASTLTQQLAKMLWLDPRKTFGRKFEEIADYRSSGAQAHQAEDFRILRESGSAGRRGSFGISGFGEAAQAFFGKDMRSLRCRKRPLSRTDSGAQRTEPVSLAGSGQSAAQRIVLKLMLDNGKISQFAIHRSCRITAERDRSKGLSLPTRRIL